METVVKPEVWLRGPVAGIHPLLMPAAHALLQCGEEIERCTLSLSTSELWTRPKGAASVGFHLKHIAGSIDRLLTYARGESLTEAQFAFLRGEEEPGEPPAGLDDLKRAARQAIHVALEVIRVTPEEDFLKPRGVGRSQLPSNVFGLLFHIAEHTQRHTGQIVTTARVVRGAAAG